MLDAPLRLSLPAVLIFIFVVVSACWWYASLLSRYPQIEPFRSRASRWFFLLDILALVCFVVVVTAVSFFLVRFPSLCLLP